MIFNSIMIVFLFFLLSFCLTHFSSHLNITNVTHDQLVHWNEKAKKRVYKRERAEDLEQYHHKQAEYFYDLIGKRDPKQVFLFSLSLSLFLFSFSLSYTLFSLFYSLPSFQVKGCERFYKTVIEPLFLVLLALTFFCCSLVIVVVEVQFFFFSLPLLLIFLSSSNLKQLNSNKPKAQAITLTIGDDLAEYNAALHFFREVDIAFDFKLLIAFVAYIYMGVAAFIGVLHFRFHTHTTSHSFPLSLSHPSFCHRLFSLYRVLWHHTDLQSLLFSSSWAVQVSFPFPQKPKNSWFLIILSSPPLLSSPFSWLLFLPSIL